MGALLTFPLILMVLIVINKVQYKSPTKQDFENYIVVAREGCTVNISVNSYGANCDK